MRHSNRPSSNIVKPGLANTTRSSARAAPTTSRAGVPRFLRALPSNAAGEHSAQQGAQGNSSAPSTALETTPESRAIAQQISQRSGHGEALPAAYQGQSDAEVRVHTDRAAEAFSARLGARAVTVGRHIFFGQGQYAPHSVAGQQLLQHELTHVAQQGGEPVAVQRDTHASFPSTLGVFGVDITTDPPAARAGMTVSMSFDPDPFGPYSTQIGMVQLANVIDQSATSPNAGNPLDWSGGPEAGRNDAQTTGAGAAQPGYFVDQLYDPAQNPRSSNASPFYQDLQQTIHPTPPSPTFGEFGWLRSPTDIHPALLRDTPGSNNPAPDMDLNFQTFARGVDNQQTYGALEWGFQIRGGVVTSDYARAANMSRPEFGEAMDRFRGYFSHEDVVVYFDTDSATISASEAAKLADARDYMDRYPDARIELHGFADQRGSADYNRGLSARRHGAVQALLAGQGIAASRFDVALSEGETTDFSAGSAAAAAGSLQANRRVVVRFVRTASTPINAP